MARIPGYQPQPFAIGQGKPIATGPFLGGFLFVLPATISSGGSLQFNHTLRTLVRHVEVVSTPSGSYPSRVALTQNTASQVTVIFESGQAAGDVLFLW